MLAVLSFTVHRYLSNTVSLNINEFNIANRFIYLDPAIDHLQKMDTVFNIIVRIFSDNDSRTMVP